MSDPMRTVSFKLPGPLDEALSELARQSGRSRSSLVREALVAYATGRQASVTARVDGLVQAVDGPADLSTHPRHLRGYGR